MSSVAGIVVRDPFTRELKKPPNPIKARPWSVSKSIELRLNVYTQMRVMAKVFYCLCAEEAYKWWFECGGDCCVQRKQGRVCKERWLCEDNPIRRFLGAVWVRTLDWEHG